MLVVVLVAGGCEKQPAQTGGVSGGVAIEKQPRIQGQAEVPVQAEARADVFWVERAEALAERVERASKATATKDGANGPGTILFVGDSITQGWEDVGGAVWRARFEGLGAINLGISGDRTVHVLHRMRECGLERLAARTRHVVLLIGTNDLTVGTTPESTADGILACVDEVRAKLPLAEVYVLEILPRGVPGDGIRPRVDACNARLRRLVESGVLRARLVATRELFLGAALDTSAGVGGAALPDGPIDAGLMPDGLHLSEQGYALLAGAVREAMSN